MILLIFCIFLKMFPSLFHFSLYALHSLLLNLFSISTFLNYLHFEHLSFHGTCIPILTISLKHLKECLTFNLQKERRYTFLFESIQLLCELIFAANRSLQKNFEKGKRSCWKRFDKSFKYQYLFVCCFVFQTMFSSAVQAFRKTFYFIFYTVSVALLFYFNISIK